MKTHSAVSQTYFRLGDEFKIEVFVKERSTERRIRPPGKAVSFEGVENDETRRRRFSHSVLIIARMAIDVRLFSQTLRPTMCG
jgi:hypothetical protein